MGQRVGMGTHGSVRGKGQPAMMSKGHGHKASQPKSCPEHAWGCQDTRFAHVPAVLAAPNHPHLPLSQAVKPLGTQNIPPLTPHQTSTCLSVQTDPPATPPCRSHGSFVTRMAKSTSNRQLLHCARRWAREKGERSPSFPAGGERAPWISTHGCPCGTLQPGECAQTEKQRHGTKIPVCW